MEDLYEILRPIGKGKFAVVYRAKRRSDDKICKSDRVDHAVFFIKHVVVTYFSLYSQQLP